MEFVISYRMSCNGSVTVVADSLAEAEAKVQEMPLSFLGSEADDGDVEIVKEGE